MTQRLHERFESWIGRTLTDASGHKIGKVEDIYTDDDTGQPEWLAVVTGHVGSNVSFVPLTGATPVGDDLQVQFPKDQVKEAPNAGSDGILSEEEEARLYAHYGLDYDQERVRLQRWVESERGGSEMEGGDRRPLGTAGSVETDDEMRRRHDDTLGSVETDDGLRRRHDGTPMSGRPGSSWADDEEIDDDHEPLSHARTEPVEVSPQDRRR